MVRGEPFYQKIRSDIEEKIKNGYYKQGEYLPSEAKLESLYKVSRTTVRNAVRSLVDDGYLTIVRGKGTKVTPSKLSASYPNLMSFTDVIQKQGIKSSLLKMKISQTFPTQEVAEKLDIDPEEKVYEIYRERAADDEPICIHISFIPCKYLEGNDVSLIERRQSLYQALEEDFNISIQTAQDNISAIGASTHVAKILNIEKGDPVLFIERVAYDQNNAIVEYSEISIRGDRYSQMVTLRKRL